MYVGATISLPPENGSWQWNASQGIMEPADPTSTSSPALLKIFDEILVNAADECSRDSSTTMIEVSIDSVEPRITICNNGRGLPVQIHPTEGIFVPELVFGHLLTGSNFDDEAARTTGGRHGYGAKLTNILSHEFTVETLDTERSLRYTQTWSDHMGIAAEPTIVPATGEKIGFTRVSFVPDLNRLGSSTAVKVRKNKFTSLGPGDVAALHRRVIEMAGCLASKGVCFKLDGQQLPVTSFPDFVSLFARRDDQSKRSSAHKAQQREGSGKKMTVIDLRAALQARGLDTKGLKQELVARLESASAQPTDSMLAISPWAFETSEGWEVAILPVSQLTKGVTVEGGHVSFANGVATPRGGSHVALASAALLKHLHERLSRNHSELGITPALIRQQFVLFLSAVIDRPAFDSQMKEKLTSKLQSDAYEPSTAFIERVSYASMLILSSNSEKEKETNQI